MSSEAECAKRAAVGESMASYAASNIPRPTTLNTLNGSTATPTLLDKVSIQFVPYDPACDLLKHAHEDQSPQLASHQQGACSQVVRDCTGYTVRQGSSPWNKLLECLMRPVIWMLLKCLPASFMRLHTSPLCATTPLGCLKQCCLSQADYVHLRVRPPFTSCGQRLSSWLQSNSLLPLPPPLPALAAAICCLGAHA